MYNFVKNMKLNINITLLNSINIQNKLNQHPQIII